MEKIEFIKNGDLSSVNKLLEEGWEVKLISACNEVISTRGQINSSVTGSVFAYIVLEK